MAKTFRWLVIALPAFLFGCALVLPFCTRLVSDGMFLSPGYYLVLAVYTAAWMFLLRSIFRIFERRTKKAG